MTCPDGIFGSYRVHGELLTLGVKVAASTVWEMLHEAGIDPAPDRAATWAQFLRSQADALLATDFMETIALTDTRMYILAVIERTATPHRGIRRKGRCREEQVIAS